MSGVSVDEVIGKAVRCLRAMQYSASCGHFCVAFKVSLNCSSHERHHRLTLRWRPTFLYAFDRHIHHLETIADNETIIQAFDEAIEALPDCEDIHYNKGIYYYKKGCLSEAVECFVSSLAVNPDYHLSHLCLENIKSSSIARWHYIMINDIKRNTVFRTAIRRAVESGYNTVLDIGAGSGLLSLYSVESGAHKVYSCEVSDMLYHLCRDVLQTNGVIDKVTLFNDMSTNLRIPQMIEMPVRLVVTEIFDAALFGEHVLTTIYSALKNLLDPKHGMVIPNKATVYGILIESEELRDLFTLNRKQFGDICVSEDVSICVDFNDMKYTTINLSKVADKKYLSQRFQVIDINFNSILQIEKLLEKDHKFSIDIECITEGRLDAIGIWFDLNLFEDIHISTEPPSELIGWEQAIYPSTTTPVTINNRSHIRLSFSLYEDFLKLNDLKITDQIVNTNDSQTIHLNQEFIKYLNATNFHDFYINALQTTIESENITKVIDLSLFPVSSLNCVTNQLLSKIIIITDDIDIKDNIQKFMNALKLESKKVDLLNFDDLISSDSHMMTNSLVLIDFIESSGLMRSNILEKLAYLNVYSVQTPHFMPFKVIIKAVLIQSNDLITRSRLISDDNVHGFCIKNLLNIFETEIIQNIDVKKIEFSELSNYFDLLEINFNQIVKSKEDINIEPNNKCIVNVSKCGQLDAILYWYELHLTQQIVINSLNMSPNWHSAAFVLKQPLPLNTQNTLHFDVMFTNGFLRFKDLRCESTIE